MLVVMTPNYTYQMSQKLMRHRRVHLQKLSDSTVLFGPLTNLTRDDISYHWLLRWCPPKELSASIPLRMGENLMKIQTTTKILQLSPIFSFPLSPIF